MDNLSRQKSSAANAVVMPNLVPKPSSLGFNKIRNEFIRHPAEFPLEMRRVRDWRASLRNTEDSPSGDLGLSFTARKRVPVGSKMEISIPLRNDVQKFHGTVVLLKEVSDGYEIGLWLANTDEASRARIVEEICHIECSLRTKSRRSGTAPNQQTKSALNRLPSPLAH